MWLLSLMVHNSVVHAQAEEGQYSLEWKLCQHKVTLWHHTRFPGPRPNFFIYWYINSWKQKKVLPWQEQTWSPLVLYQQQHEAWAHLCTCPVGRHERAHVSSPATKGHVGPTRLLLPDSGCKVFVSVWLLVFWFGFSGVCVCVFLMKTRGLRNGLDAFNPKLPRGHSSVTFSGLGYWLILNPKPAIDSLLCCILLLCPRHYLAKGQYCPN